MSPAEALVLPRYHHQYLPDIIYHEEGAFSDELKLKLENRGHKLKKRSPIGDVQLIMKKNDTACGYSDHRLPGSAGSAGN
jgi:gamma-glutamyltranspeptidase/glutathione hydrolase